MIGTILPAVLREERNHPADTGIGILPELSAAHRIPSRKRSENFASSALEVMRSRAPSKVDRRTPSAQSLIFEAKIILYKGFASRHSASSILVVTETIRQPCREPLIRLIIRRLDPAYEVIVYFSPSRTVDTYEY